MKLEEILKEQGLTEEQVKAVLEGMKANGIYTAAEEGLDEKYADLKKELEKKDPDSEKATVEIERLTKELEQAKKDAKMRETLLKENVTDLDYIMFKLAGKELKLSDDGQVSGLDEAVKEAKTQYPDFFQTDTKTNPEKKVEVKTWNKTTEDKPVEPENLRDAVKMHYAAATD